MYAATNTLTLDLNTANEILDGLELKGWRNLTKRDRLEHAAMMDLHETMSWNAECEHIGYLFH